MIKIDDRYFEISISEQKIGESIGRIAERMNHDYKGKSPVFISILNGAFMFTADLVRMLDFQPEIIFAKFSSYQGLYTTGEVKTLIGVNKNLEGRDIVIIEDIIDTGITMSEILPAINKMNPSSVRIATLLFKPEKLSRQITIDYCAMEIPNDFIVGYGLDYNGLGRNLKDIYTVVEKQEQ